MAKAIKSASSPPPAAETRFASGGSGASEIAKVPKQVAGNYPMRQVTYYQINNSDIRSIGVAQAAATICAALGTFFLSTYLDFAKDLALATANDQTPPPFLQGIVNLTFWAWLIFWCIALFAFLWQGNELRRIKSEHGEPSNLIRILSRLLSWWENGNR